MIAREGQLISNLRYSDIEGDAGLCDVRLPAGKIPPDGFPTVVVVHGGAWMSGNKWTIQSYSKALTESGFATVTINYRLAPVHPFPTQVDDVRKAMIWTSDNAVKYSFNMKKVGLFGYSAGGHLAILVATLANEPIETQVKASLWEKEDPRWQRLPSIHCVCAGGPPCDFRNLPLDNTSLAYFFGGSRRQRASTYAIASPVVHLSQGDPPLKIIHGEVDALVPIIGSERFLKAAKESGVRSDLTRISGQGHLATFLNPQSRDAAQKFFAESFAESFIDE